MKGMNLYMNTNTTQLKQETLVGNDPVLEDIFPKTDAEVVFDNGVPMDQMIDRLWNAINNKLARVVNSVNGRSGVVVLDKSDVGLNNVDNVSFADIKQWVLDQFSKANNHMQLVDEMADIDELCGTNDKTLHNAPFFAEHGYTTDTRAYIGYIYWDNDTNQLAHDQRPIPTIGSGDASIIYNEVVGDKDYTNGRIGVNIRPGENILKLYDSGDKATSGLYIDDSAISSSLLQIDGVYGNGTPTDEDALLYYDEATTPVNAKTARIYIDDNFITSGITKMRNTLVTMGTLILCNFCEYRTHDSSQVKYVYPTGMVMDLVGRSPALGKVTQVPDENLQINFYEIRFYTLKVKPGWGMKLMDDHRSFAAKNYMPTIKLATACNTHNNTVQNNINRSGLQVFIDPNSDEAILNPSHSTFDPADYRKGDYVVTPLGILPRARAGLGITTDYSMCITPVGEYDEASSHQTHTVNSVVRPYGSKEIGNWAGPIPNIYSEEDTPYVDGASNTVGTVGVNLDKTVRYLGTESMDPTPFHGSTFLTSNVSGLRITPGSTACYMGSKLPNARIKEREVRDAAWFGMNDNDPRMDYTGSGTDNYGSSGGLSINVGEFLEIDPTECPSDTDKYYESGKVNVRIGDGLEPEPEERDANNKTIKGNRIQVKTGNGIDIDSNDKSVKVKIDETRGDLSFDENGNLIVANPTVQSRVLRIQDNYTTRFDFNPSGATITAETPIDILYLGSGLRITVTE